MNDIKISPDLMQTIIDMDHIEEIHFTKDNRHFFNVQSFEGKQYGFLLLKDKNIAPEGQPRRIKKVLSANPDTLIVKTLSRAEVLAMDVTEPEEIAKDVNSKKKAFKKGATASV